MRACEPAQHATRPQINLWIPLEGTHRETQSNEKRHLQNKPPEGPSTEADLCKRSNGVVAEIQLHQRMAGSQTLQRGDIVVGKVDVGGCRQQHQRGVHGGEAVV